MKQPIVYAGDNVINLSEIAYVSAVKCGGGIVTFKNKLSQLTLGKSDYDNFKDNLNRYLGDY